MGRKIKYFFQALLMLFSLSVLLFVCYLTYLEFKPMLVDSVTLEAGAPMVNVKEFLLDKDRKGIYITDINNLDLNTPGTYEIKIKVRNRVHTADLIVADTTAPAATAVNPKILKGEAVDAFAFITDVKDATDVTVSLAEPPDTTVPGEKKVTVILEDSGNNRTELKAVLTVLDVKSFVQVEAGSVMDITPEDFVENNKYDVSFVTDLSKLDISRPAVHDIQIAVDGRVLDSKIEVIDTTPPSAQGSDQETWRDEPLEAIAFVKDVKDVSGVKFFYKIIPDFTQLGSTVVTVVLEDTYGNKSELTAGLTVKADNEPPVFSGITDKIVLIGDTVSYKKGVSVADNKDSDLSFNVDSSGVNLKKAGKYTVYYSAVDSSGNNAIADAQVTVKEFVVTDEMLNEMADKVFKNIFKDKMTKLEQARAIYDYVRGHVGYTGTSDKSDWRSEAYRGYKNSVGDCFTYFSLSKALLSRAGIDNMDVTRVGGRTRHYWNLINCGDGWYHFDACPHKDKLKSFMLTDAEVEAYTKKRGNNYYTFDKTKYPATPEE